jgi:hypothetical protein
MIVELLLLTLGQPAPGICADEVIEDSSVPGFPDDEPVEPTRLMPAAKGRDKIKLKPKTGKGIPPVKYTGPKPKTRAGRQPVMQRASHPQLRRRS